MAKGGAEDVPNRAKDANTPDHTEASQIIQMWTEKPNTSGFLLLRTVASQDKGPWSCRSEAVTSSSLLVQFIGLDGRPADGFHLCRDLPGFRV